MFLETLISMFDVKVAMEIKIIHTMWSRSRVLEYAGMGN